jgi:hypothetical protein
LPDFRQQKTPPSLPGGGLDGSSSNAAPILQTATLLGLLIG